MLTLDKSEKDSLREKYNELVVQKPTVPNAHIPQFYQKLPKEDEIISQKIREESRAAFLQHRSRILLDNEELQILWSELDKHHVPPSCGRNGEEKMINYKNYKMVAEKLGDRFKKYLTALVYTKLLNINVGCAVWPNNLLSASSTSSAPSNSPASTSAVAAGSAASATSNSKESAAGNSAASPLSSSPSLSPSPSSSNNAASPSSSTVSSAVVGSGRDPFGRISITQLFNYVMKKIWLEQTRIGLSLYDVTGQGFLKESDLENYILELIPTLCQLNRMYKEFYNYYVCTAVRKFFFFLDPMRTNRVKIVDILVCSFLDDLLELREENLSMRQQDDNWFSANSVFRVYGTYLHLDQDKNGMLVKEEFARYATGTLTRTFIDRVYEELITYDGEIDYKTYLDLILALENRKEPQAIQFIFRILDLNHRGYLTGWELNYFFQGIQEKVSEQDMEVPNFRDIEDEIFDMVKPADPLKITCKDLIDSGMGDTVIGLLIDITDFFTYENRESIVNERDADETEL